MLRALLTAVCLAQASGCVFAAKSALLADTPIVIVLAISRSETMKLKGHLRFDLRVDRADAEGALLSATTRSVTLNNLAITIDGVSRQRFSNDTRDGIFTLGIATLPLQRVPVRFDTRKALVQLEVPVRIEPPPGSARVAGVDRTGADFQQGRLSLRIWLPGDLKAPTGRRVEERLARVDIAVAARPYVNLPVRIQGFTADVISAPLLMLKTVDLSQNAVIQTVCVQPIAVAASGSDPDPAGFLQDANGNVIKDAWAVQQDTINKVWKVATSQAGGVLFQNRPWKTLVAPNLKVIHAGDDGLLSTGFPDSEPDCVEIYFIDRIANRDYNGAVTTAGGSEEAQVIFSDEIIARNIFTRLAHELGHVVKIPHPDGPMRGPDQYCGSTGTVACVYKTWDKPNLLRNSEQNIEKLSIAPKIRGSDVIVPLDDVHQADCVNSTDCGVCEPGTRQGVNCR